MAASVTSRIAINTKNNPNELDHEQNDEHTPLLRHHNSKSNIYSGEEPQDDVEAAQCLSPILDKQHSVETSRNIGGVISILLLGM